MYATKFPWFKALPMHKLNHFTKSHFEKRVIYHIETDLFIIEKQTVHPSTSLKMTFNNLVMFTVFPMVMLANAVR